MNRKILTLLCLVSGVWACSLAPPYQRPEMPTPEAWNQKATLAAGDQSAAEIPWREFFTDPALQGVIELALENNRDLRIATLTVAKVRAAYRIQRSELMPAVGVQADADLYRLPADLTSSGNAETIKQYSVNLGTAGWELDLFGRVRSLKDAAFETYLATEEGRVATQISLVSAVAGATMTLTADTEALALAKSTLEAEEKSFELIRRSADLGVASDLERAQAKSQVDAARAAVASYSGLVALDRNALTELVGAPVPADLLPDRLDGFAGLGDLAPGTPSAVLLGRPDILAAEHRLKAANADIGAARAAFFPRISLTAGAGTMSDQLSGLFGAGSGTWSFIPKITIPIFAGSALRAGVEVSQIDRDLAVADYEKAIQRAFREVNDALALRTSLGAGLQAQNDLVNSLDESYRLSEVRYKAGIDGYLGVLVAERSLDAARQGLVQLRLGKQLNLVTLYKVLGGGGDGDSGSDRVSSVSGSGSDS